MPGLLFYLTVIADSGLGVVGIRTPYEQPRYEVVRQIAPNVELRSYAARVAAETLSRDENPGEAFGRLFRYITGANTGQATLSMTVPVEQTPSVALPMTTPVAQAGPVMRFFLPSAAAGAPPAPTDPAVRIVHLPAATVGVIRYSGVATDHAREKELARLRTALQGAGVTPTGEPTYLSYDPPFALPFVRRNEVALAVTP